VHKLTARRGSRRLQRSSRKSLWKPPKEFGSPDLGGLGKATDTLALDLFR